MVGVASGSHGVNVSMNIEFDLSVEDDIIVTEHVWREEWTKPSGGNPPVKPDKTPPDLPDKPLPEESLAPEEVALAEPPKTGDNSHLGLYIGLAGMGFSAKQMHWRKREN